jgi:hypothetical protein
MAKFKVTASYITYCTTEIEADTEQEAYEIALNMDGGSFDPDPCSDSDWKITTVKLSEAAQ